MDRFSGHRPTPTCNAGTTSRTRSPGSAPDGTGSASAPAAPGDVDWLYATPDRLAYLDDGRRIRPTTTPWALVEVKTARDWENWGADGTDEVPPYHRAQCLWQMAVLGVHKVLLVAGLPHYTVRTYWIIPQDGEIEWLVDTCETFMKTIANDEPPDVDADGETYRVLRALHPDITDRDHPIPADDAHAFIRAHRNLRAAKSEAALATNRIADAMGNAHRAVHADTDRVLAHRVPANGGPPYVRPAKRLPLIIEEENTDD